MVVVVCVLFAVHCNLERTVLNVVSTKFGCVVIFRVYLLFIFLLTCVEIQIFIFIFLFLALGPSLSVSRPPHLSKPEQ